MYVMKAFVVKGYVMYRICWYVYDMA